MRNFVKIGFLIFLILLGCTPNERTDLKELEFARFAISVPSTWIRFSDQGIDSSVEGFITNKGDTVLIHYGLNAPPFNDAIQVLSMKDKIHFDSISWPYMDEMYFSDNSVVDERQGVFLREYYYYDSIDSKRTKFRLPKITGNGVVGVHFDSLTTEGHKLTLYSENVDLDVQVVLLEAFQTIKFRD